MESKNQPNFAAEFTDSEWLKFRGWLTDILQQESVAVTFKKVDGTLREMNCTLSTKLIPKMPVVESTTTNPKKLTRVNNPELVTVYDLDKGAWRSFKLRNITNIHFLILKYGGKL